jgi:negative regulator of flagellin synthesis FlgM
MNDISGINGVFKLPQVTAQRQAVAEAPSPSRGRAGGDAVEISDLGALLSRVREVPDLRVERIAKLRAEIANGTFETPERIAGTVERLLEELTG